MNKDNTDIVDQTIPVSALMNLIGLTSTPKEVERAIGLIISYGLAGYGHYLVEGLCEFYSIDCTYRVERLIGMSAALKTCYLVCLVRLDGSISDFIQFPYPTYESALSRCAELEANGQGNFVIQLRHGWPRRHRSGPPITGIAKQRWVK